MATVLQLSAQDIALFAQASGDFSPLHVDAAYARQTPFGRPVAHGVLGALRALAVLPPTASRLKELSAEFGSPMFAGQTYEASLQNATDSKVRVSVIGPSGTLMNLKVELEPGRRDLVFGPAVALPRVAAHPAPGPLETEVTWAPDSAALKDLGARGLDPAAAAALMACSYVIGMIVPGRAALFTRLRVRLEPVESVALPLSLKISASSVDERFGLSTIDVTVHGTDKAAVAKATLAAMWRRPPAGLDLTKLKVTTGSLAGQRALVIGGSRGLGAAISVALQRAGASCRSTYAATPPKLELESIRSDAASPEDNLALADALAQTGFKPDILVLNASPSFWKLNVARAATRAVIPEVAALLAPMLIPLTAHLDSLSPEGAVVLVSSSYTQDLKPDWPHYVAAKSAAEGFVRSLALAHPRRQFIIARPPRLKTDLTNTATGWEGALDPERIASDLAAALAARAPGVRVLEWEAPE
jgi:acyl dehydratase/NAD(P)-dependent dehydrogenase (short-subunit alcohol dehydrogenase family)